MTNGTDDLWPEEIGSVEVEPPITVIRKQAALLGNKTSNLVEGIVKRMVEGDDVVISFYLNAPALNDYRYKLFSVYHNIADLYPVETLRDDEQHRPDGIKDEEELSDYLRSKFNSGKTLAIIRSLMVQSRAE